MAYNSKVSDPDKLLSGSPFSFPVPPKGKGYPGHTVFLILLQTYNFSQAFAEADSARYKSLDIRILPFWLQDKGYIFNVIIDKPFKNRKRALAFLEKTKLDIAAVPKSVIALKTEDFIDKG